jgi:hypothetical protein
VWDFVSNRIGLPFWLHVAKIPYMLIFNELIFHISLEVVHETRSDELDLLIFPLHISHASQPLDVRIFKPFKQFF